MTCIVGLEDRGTIYMGGDSAATGDAGSQSLRSDPKVFRVGDLLIGCAGSFRMAQLIRFDTKLPEHKKSDTDHAYIVRRVIAAIRKSLAAGGFKDECGGNLIMGYRGRLYEIGCDFDVAPSDEYYRAIGSGEPVALGVMYATADLGWSPEARIRTALEASERYNAWCRGPFIIEMLS